MTHNYQNFHKKLDQLFEKHRIKDIVRDFNFNNEIKVYLGGIGLFTDFGQLGYEILADICEKVGLLYYLPQHADFNDKASETVEITNKMIADGDNKELATCQFLFAHIQAPLDEGMAGEISRFKTMSEYDPRRYWGVVGWVDDIRTGTIPNPKNTSFDNQTIYFNQFCMGECQNSLGCYHTLYECFEKMFKLYQFMK